MIEEEEYINPIAAGKGSGNLKFSIVPGSPQRINYDLSI